MTLNVVLGKNTENKLMNLLKDRKDGSDASQRVSDFFRMGITLAGLEGSPYLSR